MKCYLRGGLVLDNFGTLVRTGCGVTDRTQSSSPADRMKRHVDQFPSGQLRMPVDVFEGPVVEAGAVGFGHRQDSAVGAQQSDQVVWAHRARPRNHVPLWRVESSVLRQGERARLAQR